MSNGLLRTVFCNKASVRGAKVEDPVGRAGGRNCQAKAKVVWEKFGWQREGLDRGLGVKAPDWWRRGGGEVGRMKWKCVEGEMRKELRRKGRVC